MRLVLNMAAVLVTAAAAGAEPADDAAAVELRETIARWIEVEDTISAERSGWQAEKASMAELLEVHRKELELLDEELAKAGMSAGGHDERMTGARAAVDRLRAARAAAAETVAAAVPRLRRLAGAFPEPLRAEAGDDLAALETWSPGDEPRDGLRAVLGVLARAEAFNRRLTRTREVRDGREVEVLYLGLARAYFVGGGTAGVGVPSTAGWKWRAAPDLAGAMEQALEVLDKRRAPKVVRLPVAVGVERGDPDGDPEHGGSE